MLNLHRQQNQKENICHKELASTSLNSLLRVDETAKLARQVAEKSEKPSWAGRCQEEKRKPSFPGQAGSKHACLFSMAVFVYIRVFTPLVRHQGLPAWTTAFARPGRWVVQKHETSGCPRLMCGRWAGKLFKSFKSFQKQGNAFRSWWAWQISMYFIFSENVSDDCVGGGQGKLSKTFEAFRRLSKAKILRPEGVWGKIYVKFERIYWFLLKNTYFPTKNSWFRLIFSDFIVNYNDFLRFSVSDGIRQKGSEALRRSKLPKWSIF